MPNKYDLESLKFVQIDEISSVRDNLFNKYLNPYHVWGNYIFYIY